MNLKKLIITLAAVAASISQGLAFEPIQKFASRGTGWPDCVGKFCGDDYRQKPSPSATRVKCFECPDYRPKPLPCAPPVKVFGGDDYHPKRLPPVCSVGSKNLRCVPSRLPPTDRTWSKKGKPHAPHKSTKSQARNKSIKSQAPNKSIKSQAPNHKQITIRKYQNQGSQGIPVRFCL